MIDSSCRREGREKRVYLGDSVYVWNDGYHVVLELDNGLGPHNEIAMDPNVLLAFNEYLIRMIREDDDEKEQE